MKTLMLLICSLVACAVGYWAEPSLRSHLTAPVTSKNEKTAAKPPVTVIAIQPAPEKKSEELLPEKVTLREKVEFSDVSSGLTMTLAAGSEVRLLRIKGDEAVIRIGESKYTHAIPIGQTDLAVRLGKEEAPSVEPEVVATPDAPTQPEPVTAPVVAPEIPVEVVKQPEAQPEPLETAEPPAPPAGANDVVGIMRDSIRNREIKKFEFTQVKDWEAGADETLEGQTYQTGTLTYQAETIFGVQTIQAKAFIQNGKVVRWIWPKSGVQIE
jgi:hypothetical protein